MNTNSKGMWIIVVILLIIIAALTYFLVIIPAPLASNTTHEPTSTVTNTGVPTGTETGSNVPAASKVIVDAPKSGAKVPKTFTVTGQAPGTWYFEATFPVRVLDANNKVVGSGHATALSDWMTTAQVSFKADVTVTAYTGPATLVLSRDNPSGLPENDQSVSIPITIQ